MTTIFRELSELTLLPNNPRTITKQKFKKLCHSIQTNGFLESKPLILSDRIGKLVILGGNQRYKSAKKLGIQRVPTFLHSELTIEQEKTIILLDNINNGKFDMDIVANEWPIFLLEEYAFDLPKDFTLDNLDEEDLQIKEKKPNVPTKFILTIACDLKTNFDKIKQELDRLKIGYTESEK